MSDFAEDIDTLLVFVSPWIKHCAVVSDPRLLSQAGLFSAVLTAFVIAACPLLQQDNSRLSVQLLSVIALRLGEPSTQPNASTTPLPDSTTFQPSSTILAINALWFVSLVLSLAAALFGILAKQWCREYLKWYAAPEPAIDNVLLRQLRFEAWQRSNATSIVASVPALLETALVLFVTGLIVFVWTLHWVVAVPATIAIVLLLVLASGLTLMPVFSHVSPYKSPTGWAVLRLAHVVLDFRRRLGSRRSRRIRSFVAPPSDWRAHDMQYAHSPPMSETQTISQALSGHTGSDSARCSITDAFQAMLLIRLLLWLQHGSNETALSPAIVESARSINARPALRSDRPSTLGYHCTSYTILPPLWTSLTHFANHMSIDRLTRRVSTDPLSGRREVTTKPYFACLFVRTARASPLAGPPPALTEWIAHSGRAPVLREAILQDLSLLADDWASGRVSAVYSNRYIQTTVTFSWAREAVGMLSVLQIVMLLPLAHDADHEREREEHCHRVLLSVVRRLWTVDEAWQLGVVTAILYVLSRTREVTVDNLNCGSVESGPSFTSKLLLDPECPSADVHVLLDRL